MARAALVVILIGIVLLGGGVLALGVFPPHPHIQQVSRVLPNAGFATSGVAAPNLATH